MLSRALTLVCVVAALILGLAACGKDREGSGEPSGSSTGTTTTKGTPGGATVASVGVKETEYALDPKDPSVAKVGVVALKVENAGKITHALEVEVPGGEVKTGGIEPGKGATLKADLSKPGTYEWYCPIADHKKRGMKGEITVAGAGPGAAKGDSGKGDSGKGDSGKGDSGKGDSGKGGSGLDKSGGSRSRAGGTSGGSGGY